MKQEIIKIKIIIGSTRVGRFSEKPAHFIYDEVMKIEGVEVELLDLRDYPMPFFNEPMPPSMLKENYSNEIVRKWAVKIKDGDAFIVITPEYNHGSPAVLKNALDSIYPEWNKKPISFVSYGSVSGARSIEQLRQNVIELQMMPTRNSINIPSDIYRSVMNEKSPINPELFKALKEPVNRIEILVNELVELAKVLKKLR